MAKANVSVPVKKENRFARYFKETRAELRKVTWLTRDEALHLTGVVIAITVGMALLLGAIDFVFEKTIEGILNHDYLRIGLAAIIAIVGPPT